MKERSAMFALLARRTDEKVVAGFDLLLMRLSGWSVLRELHLDAELEEEEENVYRGGIRQTVAILLRWNVAGGGVGWGRGAAGGEY